MALKYKVQKEIKAQVLEITVKWVLTCHIFLLNGVFNRNQAKQEIQNWYTSPVSSAFYLSSKGKFYSYSQYLHPTSVLLSPSAGHKINSPLFSWGLELTCWHAAPGPPAQRPTQRRTPKVLQLPPPWRTGRRALKPGRVDMCLLSLAGRSASRPPPPSTGHKAKSRIETSRLRSNVERKTVRCR